MKIIEIYRIEEMPVELLLMADPSSRSVHEYIQNGRCFVLDEDGVIRGAFVLLPTEANTIEMVNIVVEESYQNKGFGKMLVMEAFKIARSNGYQQMEIRTGNSSIGQLALYQKCGFRISDVARDYFIKHYDEPIFENGIQCRDQIILTKNLAEYIGEI